MEDSISGIFHFCNRISVFRLLFKHCSLGGAAVATGIGFGLTIPLLNHMTVESSSPKNIGRNLSYYSIGIFGGQFMSSFLGLISSDPKNLFIICAVIAFVTFFGLNKIKHV